MLFDASIELLPRIDALLSIRSTPQDCAHALVHLEKTIASLIVVLSDSKTARLDAFLTCQDKIEWNLTAVLLDWLGRAISVLSLGANDDTAIDRTRSNLIRCLSLLQGLCLIHRPSQKVFARRCSIEYLLAVLDLSRPSHVSSPLLSYLPPSPSPIHLASTPAPHLKSPLPTSSSADPSQLALIALDTLLCAVVDRPENMRAFEDAGGLNIVVKVLKDKSVAQTVRIKVIELLYYFLLPEVPKQSSSNSGARHLSQSAHPTLSTPSRPKFHPRSSTPPPRTPTSTSFASKMLPRSDLLETVSDGFVPQTPVKALRRASSSQGRGGEDSCYSPSRNTPRGSQFNSHNHSTPKMYETRRNELSEGEESERTPRRTFPNVHEKSGVRIRSIEEKKELLRKVMPNVDALEERFKAMGLGLGLS